MLLGLRGAGDQGGTECTFKGAHCYGEEKAMTLFSSFREAKEGSTPGSEFRGRKGPSFLSPREGFLEEGAGLNVQKGEQGPVGKGPG